MQLGHIQTPDSLIDGVAARPVGPALVQRADGRFALRPLRASDAGLIGLHTSDLRVARATSSIPHPLPPGTTEAFIARATAPDARERVWVLDGAAQGSAEVLGLIGLKAVDREQWEIGYWIAPGFWNAGLASAAVRALVADNPVQARTLFASVFQDNPASARVLTNSGFEYLGDAERFSVARGAQVPTWTYLRRMEQRGGTASAPNI
jgi:RimJ/RimL family protein N-acetyltransferase